MAVTSIEITPLITAEAATESVTLYFIDNTQEQWGKYVEKQEELSQKEFIKQWMEESYVGPRDRVYNTPELFQEALERAQRCKEENLGLLEKYRMIP